MVLPKVMALLLLVSVLGIAALVAVFALVANAIVLSMRSREKEISVLQTLGFRGIHLAILVLLEALMLGAVGGVIGAGASYTVVSLARTAMTMEGVSIAIPPSLGIALTGVVVAIALSLLAGIVPAIIAARQTIVAGLRS